MSRLADRCARSIAVVFALALSVPFLSAAPAAPAAPEVSASVLPGELTYGAALTLSGRLLDAGQGVGDARLALQADPYPFRGFITVAHLTTAADGSFALAGVKPNRNTRVRVVTEGSHGARSPVLAVIVDPKTATNAVGLGRGRTRLSVHVRHTVEGGSASVSAWWFVAARGSRVFRLIDVTPTRELSAGVTYASATIDPPSDRFSYRVCFNPTWEDAMGTPASHRPCPERDYAVRRNVG
jgi:hypothetical protein